MRVCAIITVIDSIKPCPWIWWWLSKQFCIRWEIIYTTVLVKISIVIDWRGMDDFNSLTPGDGYMQLGTGSSLVQVMACRLSPLIVNLTLRNKVQWNLYPRITTARISVLNPLDTCNHPQKYEFIILKAIYVQTVHLEPPYVIFTEHYPRLCDTPNMLSKQWVSYQIRKIEGCACAGKAGNVTHVPWCMPGSLTSGFLCRRRRGKRSRHSRRMLNRQFYISSKRPMGCLHKYTTARATQISNV